MWHWLEHWFLHVTGTAVGPNGNRWSNFWSGWGGTWVNPEWFVAGTIVYWHHTCHVRRCWRIRKFETSAGDKVCRRHHPDKSNQAPTAEQVAKDHKAMR